VVEIEGAQAAHRETLQFTGQGIACQSACNRFSAGFKQQGQAVEQVVWTLGSSPSAGKCDHDNPIPRE
jgi:hypothetical protein